MASVEGNTYALWGKLVVVSGWTTLGEPGGRKEGRKDKQKPKVNLLCFNRREDLILLIERGGGRCIPVLPDPPTWKHAPSLYRLNPSVDVELGLSHKGLLKRHYLVHVSWIIPLESQATGLIENTIKGLDLVYDQSATGAKEKVTVLLHVKNL